jgi:hypothetical protein
VLRERARQLGARDQVLPRYERVCFDKAALPGPPRASLLCPGHPLLDAVVDLEREQHGLLLRQGAVLVDPQGDGTEPRLLVALRHALHDGWQGPDGEPLVIAEQLVFVSLHPDGRVTRAGPAPYLDLRPADAAEIEAAQPLLAVDWLAGDAAQRALMPATPWHGTTSTRCTPAATPRSPRSSARPAAVS